MTRATNSKQCHSALQLDDTNNRDNNTSCNDNLNTPTNDDGHSSILANDLLATLDLVINMRIGVSITRALFAYKLVNQVNASVLACKDLATTQAGTIPPTPSSFPQSSIEQ